jgi:hypothetical protein
MQSPRAMQTGKDSLSPLRTNIDVFSVQLHVHQRHPDMPLLEHSKELIAKLESMGFKPVPLDEVGDDDDWEEVESSDDDGDGDVEMS